VELSQIRYFLTLSRELNFTRAAELCHVSQPALTRAIKNLEDELGGELFRRERGNTHLTDLGRMVKPHLEQVLAATEAVKEEAESFRSGTKAPLKLGVMCTISPYLIVSFLRSLRDKLPAVEPQLLELPGRELLEAMMRGEMDVAMVGLPNLPERLDPIPLFTERYGVVFAKGHPFEKLNAVPVPKLADIEYVQRPACEFPAHWQALGQPEFPVQVVYRSEREEWVQAILAAGIGCAVLPEFQPRLEGLVFRLLVEPEVTRTVSLVTVAGRRFTPATKAVVQLARSFRWETA
jgi:DNA-binding transcriptional LysR family regulator